MNKTWLISIITITFILLALLKAHAIRSTGTFFKADKVIRLESFEKARKTIAKEDIDHLELWESMLTGRSAPISKLIKQRYQLLGMNHIFTPSGFHLSAVLFPFLKVIRPRFHVYLLIALGFGLIFLPGFTALKRMLLIKTNQKLTDIKLGFVSALIIDIMCGSFQHSTLSFTYSFLFLGIIYSGLERLGLIIWFFFAQILLAYFQDSQISFMMLLLSPFLNFVFALAMPVLLLMSYPLALWQLNTGLFVIQKLQSIVDVSARMMEFLPSFEVNIAVICLLGFVIYQRWRIFQVGLLMLSFSLNHDLEKIPGRGMKDFVPQGPAIKTVYDLKEVRVYFEDGSCRMKLVRGFWYENCSPLRRSNRYKKLKKLSYLSEELRMSSLRG